MPTGTESPARLMYVATVSATVDRFLVPLALHFRAQGWRVDAAAAGVSIDPHLPAAFDDLYEIPFSRSIRDVRSLLRSERALSRLLRREPPDVIHVHTPIASFVTRLVVRRMPAARRPVVLYTAHGFHFYRGGRVLANHAFLAAEKLVGRWTDRLVVINDEDEDAALRHRIVAPRRLVRMPGIGVDTDFFTPTEDGSVASGRTPTSFGLPRDARFFVTVGELSSRKRQADLIRALARTRDASVFLVLLGEGSRRPDLEGLARQLKAERRVIFAGHVTDVRAIVGSSVALLASADREGLTRSLMEALSLEVPIVASSARGNHELVADSGFVVDIGDVDGFARAMDWLLAHPAEAREMGRRGRERMIARYDLSVVLRQHDALYREVLNERAMRRSIGT